MFAAVMEVLRPKAALRRVLGDAKLPTFSKQALEALRVLRDPNTSPAEIAAVVASDPGLAVEVLKTVNSAAYGLRSRVNNVNHAAILLGRSELEAVVLAAAVRDAVKAPPAFWAEATHRAATARRLAERIDPSQATLAMTGALLQDVAVPLLLRHKKGYRQIFRRWKVEGGGLSEREQDAYGFDHAEVAGWLCELWHFPEDLSDVITSHHAEVKTPVQLAALLDEGPDVVVETVHERFGLDRDEVRAILEEGRGSP